MAHVRPASGDPPDRPRLTLLRLLFFAIYFVQKISNNAEGISKMPFITLLKGPVEAGGFALKPAQAGMFRADSSLGWYVKALYGPVVDSIPLFGYRRKGWLMFSSALAALAWAWVALFGHSSLALLFIGILFVNMFIALGDVICDGMMVEMSQHTEATYGLKTGEVNRELQAAQWFGAMVAITIGALGGGVIAQFFSFTSAALVSGLLPLLLIFLIAVAVPEERVAWDSVKAQRGFKAIGLLVGVSLLFIGMNRLPDTNVLSLLLPLIKMGIIVFAMTRVVTIPRELYLPTVFMMLWFWIPFNLDGGYCVAHFTKYDTNFVNALRASDGTIGWIWQLLVTLKLVPADELAEMLASGSGLADLYYGSVQGSVGAIGGVFGALLFGLTLKRAPLQYVLFTAIALQAAMATWMYVSVDNITPLHLLLFSFVNNATSLVVLLSAMSFATTSIPDRDQATLYAFLMSFTNISQQYGIDVIGGKVYDAFGGATPVLDDKGELADTVMQNPLAGMTAVLILSLIAIAGNGCFVVYMRSRGVFRDMATADN